MWLAPWAPGRVCQAFIIQTEDRGAGERRPTKYRMFAIPGVTIIQCLQVNLWKPLKTDLLNCSETQGFKSPLSACQVIKGLPRAQGRGQLFEDFITLILPSTSSSLIQVLEVPEFDLWLPTDRAKPPSPHLLPQQRL